MTIPCSANEICDKVSTVITSFNKAPWLGEAIDSALIQDFPHQEVIVVDDGSTDNTAAVCRKYGDRIRYIWQENQGCPAAKNTGIRAAHGEFIAILDGDDRWRPGKLTKQVNLLRERPEVGLVFTDRLKFRDDRVTLPSNWLIHTPRRGWVLDDLLQDNFISVSSVVARRRCLFEAGLFNPDQRVASDFDLWLRFARKFQVDYVDEVLMEYRLGIDSIGSRVKNKFEDTMNIQNRFVREFYGGNYPNRKAISRATANRMAMKGNWHLSCGQQGMAIRAHWGAWRWDPWNVLHVRNLLRTFIPAPLVRWLAEKVVLKTENRKQG